MRAQARRRTHSPPHLAENLDAAQRRCVGHSITSNDRHLGSQKAQHSRSTSTRVSEAKSIRKTELIRDCGRLCLSSRSRCLAFHKRVDCTDEVVQGVITWKSVLCIVTGRVCARVRRKSSPTIRKERQAPSPRGELGRADHCRGNQKYQVRENDAGRQSECDQASEKTASPLWSVLDRHQNSTAPLSAECKSLQESKKDKQCRSPGADTGIVWKQADAEPSETHEYKAPNECRFPPDMIAEVPHDDSAKWTCKEPDSKCRERSKSGGQRRNLR